MSYQERDDTSELIQVNLYRYEEILRDRKALRQELKRAQSLIRRLRAEKAVAKGRLARIKGVVAYDSDKYRKLAARMPGATLQYSRAMFSYWINKEATE